MYRCLLLLPHAKQGKPDDGIIYITLTKQEKMVDDSVYHYVARNN